jgi:PKD repeat protein
MICRRTDGWIRLLPLALVLSGCDGGQAGVSPTPAAPAPAGFSLTCAVGTGDCSAAMQGQTVTFTARPGTGAGTARSAALNFGDGSPSVDFGTFTAAATATHEYGSLGSFTARLDVTMASGETKTVTQPVKVDSLVTASLGATNLGDLNVEATADVEGAPVVRYDWLFEPDGPVVSTTEPRVLFTYATPGYKAVQLRAVLADGRVILASGHVVVGREHEA